MGAKRYLIAIDPFIEELHPTAKAVELLRNLLKTQNAKLDAVYVVSTEHYGEHWNPEREAKHQLEEYVRGMDLPTPVHCHILREETASTRNAVRAVIDYARKINAKTIFLTSYGRRVLGRLVLGSFADTLLAYSFLPTFFLNGHPKRTEKIKNVLFPTDFSPHSKIAFELFLEQFKGIHPHLFLLHSKPHYQDLSTYNSISGRPGNYDDNRSQFIKNESNRWIELAEKKGYSIEFILRDQHEGIRNAIKMEATIHPVDLIALASTRGDSRTRVLGSISSFLFYQRVYPIWICGPEVVTDFSAPKDISEGTGKPREPFDELSPSTWI